MNSLHRIEGRAYPLGRNNIDTGVIIASAHSKAAGRAGLGVYAFGSIRAEPGNVFVSPAFAGAPILIAGDNFGCGSDSELAAWALLDMGIKAVIACGFSDVFAGNAIKSGIVTISLWPEAVARLMRAAEHRAISIDLEAMTVAASLQDRFRFELGPFRRQCLLDSGDEML